MMAVSEIVGSCVDVLLPVEPLLLLLLPLPLSLLLPLVLLLLFGVCGNRAVSSGGSCRSIAVTSASILSKSSSLPPVAAFAPCPVLFLFFGIPVI